MQTPAEGYLYVFFKQNVIDSVIKGTHFEICPHITYVTAFKKTHPHVRTIIDYLSVIIVVIIVCCYFMCGYPQQYYKQPLADNTRPMNFFLLSTDFNKELVQLGLSWAKKFILTLSHCCKYSLVHHVY